MPRGRSLPHRVAFRDQPIPRFFAATVRSLRQGPMGPDTFVRMCGIRNDRDTATWVSRASSCTIFQRYNPFHLLLYVSVLPDKRQGMASVRSQRSVYRAQATAIFRQITQRDADWPRASIGLAIMELTPYSRGRHFERNSRADFKSSVASRRDGSSGVICNSRYLSRSSSAWSSWRLF